MVTTGFFVLTLNQGLCFETLGLLLRPGRVRSFAMSACVCLYVCPLAYLKSDMSKLHEIFCTCCRGSVLL